MVRVAGATIGVSVEPLAQYFRVVCFDAKGYGFPKTSVSRKNDHQIMN